MMRSSIFLIGAVLIGMSCSKHGSDQDTGETTATIQFISPAPSAVFHNSDSVIIDAQIQGSAVLHGYEVWLRRVGDTTSYLHALVHDHSQNIHARHAWKDTLSTIANMEATITVILDHDGHTKTQSTVFTVL